MAASSCLYKIPMQEVLAAIETLCRKSRYRCTTSSYLYQLGVKSLAIRPSVTAPGLLRRKMKKMRGRQYQQHRL